jgi:serine kinase of HPr protein (carbohydrate metabolism regulator)
MGELLHATGLLIDGAALLITGKPGAGKSDLALRLIDRGARLIADDYTMVEARDGALYATPPPTIAGRIEIRGIGIVDVEYAEEGPVALIVDLDAKPTRMPEDLAGETRLCGIAVPTIALAAFEMSAPLKAEWALRLFGRRPR